MSRRFLLSVALVFAIVISTSALLPLPVTPQDGPGSTDDQIPVIISLNTAEFVSSEHSRVTSFDALKAEVVFSLSQKQPHALSIDSKESRGQLKRDSRPINALSANIPLSLRDELLQLNAIEEIYPDIKMHVLVDKSVPLVNTPAVWQLKDSEGDYVTGKGVLVAVLGTGVNYSVLKGIAPDATLLAYKVLEPSESGHASGDTSDIIAGIERAVNDDADIMCMSFGCMFGQGPSPIERAVDAAVSDGVTVVAGAGNGGPSIGSIASPAGYKNVIAVGAVEKERDVATVEVIPENKILYADTMEYSPLANVSGELVFAGFGYPENFTYRSFKGTIALIIRGELWFNEKVRNAYDAGAIGAIIFNNRPGNFSGSLMNESEIPAVSLSHADGNYLLELMERRTVVVRINQTNGISYDSISLFSSLGPGPGYTIKPNVVAPGSNIKSTSFEGGYAAAYVSGACALLLQLYPEWTPEDMMAAVMNTAQDLGYCPFVQGAGRIDVFKAATTEILALPPSISSTIDGSVTSVFTVKNLKNYPIRLNVSIVREEVLDSSFCTANLTTPDIIDLTPAELTLDPHESKQIHVTVTLPEDNYNIHYCGRIAINSTNSAIAVPFAFNRSLMQVDNKPSTILSAINPSCSGIQF
jgi:subtilisin family serine protease